MTIDTSLDANDVALSDAPLGEVTVTADDVIVVFRRRYGRPIEKVWAAITTPERIADWLAAADMELKVGGAICLNWNNGAHTMEGRIVAYDPPHILAWTWPLDERETIVRFELESEANGCILTLTHSGLSPSGKSGSGVRAGWHAHLEGLPAAIDGKATPWSVKRARETVLSPLYPPIVG